MSEKYTKDIHGVHIQELYNMFKIWILISHQYHDYSEHLYPNQVDIKLVGDKTVTKSMLLDTGYCTDK